MQNYVCFKNNINAYLLLKNIQYIRYRNISVKIKRSGSSLLTALSHKMIGTVSED